MSKIIRNLLKTILCMTLIMTMSLSTPISHLGSVVANETKTYADEKVQVTPGPEEVQAEPEEVEENSEEITEPVAANLRFFVSMCLQERFQSLFIRSHCMYLRIRTLSVPEKPDHFLNFPQVKSQCRQEH